MPLPARFSKLLERARDFVGYDSTKPPTTVSGKLLDLRQRVTEAETHFQTRNADHIYWRNYMLGDMQRDKYADQFETNPELATEFVVTNYTRALVSHLISLLSSALGEAFVVANDEANTQAANRLTEYLRAVRHRDNYSRQIRWWLEDAAVCGGGWLRCWYDQERDEIMLRRQDAITVYPEPNAASTEQAEFIAVRHVFNTGYARKLWPKLDVEQAEEESPPKHADEGRGKQMIVRQLVIWEVYHDFGDALTIFSGDQILYTGEAPVKGKGYPLFHYTFIPSNDEIRGYSILRDLEDLQDLINRVTTRMAFWQRFWANPQVTTDDPTAEIDNEPGGVWRTKPGKKALPVEPPAFPSELFAFAGQARQSLDTITGIQEVNRGIRPEGVTAGVALDLLRQASEQRMTGPLEDANGVLCEVFRMLLALAQAYYVGARAVPRMSNGNMGMARVEPTDLYTLGSEPNPETGEPEPTIIAHDYQIVMQPPGDLPRSPAAKAELGLQLFAAGAIDQTSLLEAVKWEDRKEVLQRAAQMAQAAMQGQVAGMQDAAAAQEAAAAQQQMQMVQ